jgi:hypothetical protein
VGTINRSVEPRDSNKEEANLSGAESGAGPANYFQELARQNASDAAALATDELESQTAELATELEKHLARGLVQLIKTGAWCAQMKKKNCPHGKWYEWLQLRGINPRTAQLYMQVFREAENGRLRKLKRGATLTEALDVLRGDRNHSHSGDAPHELKQHENGASAETGRPGRESISEGGAGAAVVAGVTGGEGLCEDSEGELGVSVDAPQPSERSVAREMAGADASEPYPAQPSPSQAETGDARMDLIERVGLLIEELMTLLADVDIVHHIPTKLAQLDARLHELLTPQPRAAETGQAHAAILQQIHDIGLRRGRALEVENYITFGGALWVFGGQDLASDVEPLGFRTRMRRGRPAWTWDERTIVRDKPAKRPNPL